MYVLFEGVDTCGKSTQIELFKERKKGILATKEPGGTAIGVSLRKILLEGSEKLSTNAELFLFLADRAEHYEKVVKPNREKMTVLSDRGFISGISYALANHFELSQEYLIELNKFAIDGNFPEKVVLFLSDFDLICERLGAKDNDSIEARGIEYLLRVQLLMQETLKKLPIEVLEVDARHDIETIYNLIEDFIYD
ncbi:MAG: dTMP kinase [Sulfurospirillaceae bacterium]|nr:dTMP kinase [Sulfurospirillaceae bacterium]